MVGTVSLEVQKQGGGNPQLDQKELLNSIAKHMDSISQTLKAAILSAMIFLWSGITGQNVVKAFGMELERSYALFAACAFYVLVNLAILTDLLRIGDLIKLTESSSLRRALTRLATHKLFCNPFAYYGNSIVSRIHSAHGFGTLIVIWWLCNSSLFALARTSFLESSFGLALQGLFLLVGLASMAAINRVYALILSRTKNEDPDLYAALKTTQIERTVFAFLGIGLGGLIAFVSMNLAYKS